MHNKIRTLAASALFCLLSISQVSAADIRIGTEGAYPPFNFYTADGKLAGFDVEIGEALCEQMQKDCSFVAQDWDGIIPALLANKYDVILASMFITDKRKKMVDFTDPYQMAAMTFVVDKHSTLSKFDDQTMDGMAIGAQGSTTQADYLEALFPNADLRFYPTQDAVNLDLASGRLDAQVGDLLPMLEWIEKTDDGSCCKLAGEPITDPTYVGDGVGMAVRQEDDVLRADLNKALAAIIANGTYQAINDKYFSLNLLTLK
ncbi:MAG: transporter substrate-binding domain-containing protein [Gammaproteobacteria bacterium]|nr:transporter substrate-binding domain-containing protein [Gammaproteobacteria bacterium]